MDFEKNLVMCVVKKKSLKFKKEIFMKKIVSIILIILLLGAVASMSSCAKEKNDANTPETIENSSADAIEKAKGNFESSLHSDSKYSKVHSPSYGKCSAELVEDKNGNYWKVTLNGSFRYYTDVYASGVSQEKDFTETYRIPQYERVSYYY